MSIPSWFPQKEVTAFLLTGGISCSLIGLGTLFFNQQAAQIESKLSKQIVDTEKRLKDDIKQVRITLTETDKKQDDIKNLIIRLHMKH